MCAWVDILLKGKSFYAIYTFMLFSATGRILLSLRCPGGSFPTVLVQNPWFLSDVTNPFSQQVSQYGLYMYSLLEKLLTLLCFYHIHCISS